MPATVHNRLGAYLQSAIFQQIIEIANNSTAGLAKGIRQENSTLVILQDGTSRYPGAQFRHVVAIYPGVIIEVSNSQSKKYLGYLADQYVVQSNGSVKVVIGIKLDCGKTLKAKLPLWRPQYVKKSGQEYLVSEQEIFSEVREMENLYLGM